MLNVLYFVLKCNSGKRFEFIYFIEKSTYSIAEFQMVVNFSTEYVGNWPAGFNVNVFFEQFDILEFYYTQTTVYHICTGRNGKHAKLPKEGPQSNDSSDTKLTPLRKTLSQWARRVFI